MRNGTLVLLCMAAMAAMVISPGVAAQSVKPLNGFTFTDYDNPLAGARIVGCDGWNAGDISLVYDGTPLNNREGTSIRVTKASPWEPTAKFAITTPGPIQIGTVITIQTVWPHFADPMPYTLRLGRDGAASDWANIAPQANHGAGTLGTTRVLVNPVDQPGEYNAIYVEGSVTTYQDMGTFDFKRAMVLPDRYEQVPGKVTVSTENMNVAYGGLADASDSDWGTYWYTTSLTGELTFSFADPNQRIDAIIFMFMDNAGGTSFTLMNGDGTAMAAVAAGAGVILPLLLDNPVYTDKFVLSFANTGDAGFNEVIFLTRIIPEPATMTLLALGGLALLRRRAGR